MQDTYTNPIEKFQKHCLLLVQPSGQNHFHLPDYISAAASVLHILCHGQNQYRALHRFLCGKDCEPSKFRAGRVLFGCLNLCRTRFSVSLEKRPFWLMTRETVAVETPANRAISLMFFAFSNPSALLWEHQTRLVRKATLSYSSATARCPVSSISAIISTRI